MLTHIELLSLSHLLRKDLVLSVYIGGAAEDPAQQGAWRVRLDNSLKTLRWSLERSSHAERAVFDSCVTLLEERLARADRPTGAPGWAAFITTKQVHEAGPVLAEVPTTAVWTTGPCVTPYLRALKQSRPVAVVIIDASAARLYSYVAGELTPVETVHAHAATEPPLHMGNPPSVNFHGGTRGSTGRDAAQRTRTEGTNRMVDRVAHAVTAAAGQDGWIVVGGIPGAGGQLARVVERFAAGRVVRADALDVHATDAEVALAAQHGASALRDAADLRRVMEIIENAEPTGLGSLGAPATAYALDQSSVRELYLTERYVEDHLTSAEDAVRAALAQRAVVEIVSRDVARRLDDHGGIGALLRYRLPARSPAAGTTEPAVAG